MSKPQVSVIIPAYNCAGYISNAIDSALDQDVELEIIVIDDCSGDNLEEVMEKYRDNPALFYVKNSKNLGVAQSRNRGVRLARGRYIAFLDADDYWEKGKLKKQLEAIEETGAVLCCTAREMIQPNGESTGKMIPVKERLTYKELLKHNSINCSSVLLEAAVAREFSMEHDDSHEDYIMWLEILQKYRYACGINEPLLKYRLNPKGKSSDKLKSAAMTFKVYRYMGFGWIKSILCFCSYALHGVWKHSKGNSRRNRKGAKGKKKYGYET